MNMAQKFISKNIFIISFYLLSLMLISGCSSTKANLDGKALWYGKWDSKSTSLVGGKLEVLLPDPIPKNQEFVAKTQIRYRFLFIPAGGKSIDFKGSFGSSNISDGNAEGDSTANMITFKAKVPGGKQEIDYIATIDKDKKIISGGYISIFPHDIGTFYIKKCD